MILQTKIALRQVEKQVDYSSQLFLLGSCFANNMGYKFGYFKFQSLKNPFGILFHPLAIETLISRALSKEYYTAEDIFFFNERWHCFDAHSDLSNPSKEELLQNLNEGLQKTRQQIIKSTHILITLGTAWVYRKNESDAVVANCHKVPQQDFSKELLSVEAIQRSLENSIGLVKSVNDNVHFIVTVSPVRHVKDGFVENQRSKAHLITAIHKVIQAQNVMTDVSYFASYEIMMDELRDYRFFESDMVHPNQLAIDYIWDKFKGVWISKPANATIEKVDAVQKGLSHKPFNAKSEGHQKFLKSLAEKISYLQEKYPFMEFK